MKKNKNISIYDKTKLYEQEIEIKLKEIKKLCAKNDIPFFCGFAVKNTENKTSYKYDGFLPAAMDLVLTDDIFNSHLGVIRGFKVSERSLPSDLEIDGELLAEMETDLDTDLDEDDYELSFEFSDEEIKLESDIVASQDSKDTTPTPPDEDEFFESFNV